MHRESTLKKLQNYIIMFLITVVIGLVLQLTKITIPFLGSAISMLSLATYVLLWVGYSKAKKMNLVSKNKYLILAILLTVVTIASAAMTMYMSYSMMTSALSTAGVSMDAVASLSQQELLDIAAQTLPQYATTMKIVSMVHIVFELVYLGLGAMIFMDNRKAQEEMTKSNYVEF